MIKSDVLDKGFIEVVDSLGDDLTVVNSARVSFGKRKTKYDNLRKELKKERDTLEQKRLQREMQVQHDMIDYAKNELDNALRDSNGVKINPQKII